MRKRGEIRGEEGDRRKEGHGGRRGEKVQERQGEGQQGARQRGDKEKDIDNILMNSKKGKWNGTNGGEGRKGGEEGKGGMARTEVKGGTVKTNESKVRFFMMMRTNSEKRVGMGPEKDGEGRGGPLAGDGLVELAKHLERHFQGESREFLFEALAE